MMLDLLNLKNGFTATALLDKLVLVKGGKRFERLSKFGNEAELEYSDNSDPLVAFIWDGPFPIVVEGDLLQFCATVLNEAHAFHMQGEGSSENYVELLGERTLLVFQSIRGTVTARKSYSMHDSLVDRKRWVVGIINEILVSVTGKGRKEIPASVPVAIPPGPDLNAFN